MIEAVNDKILVKIIYTDNVGNGKIFIPDTIKKNISDFHGEVISVGESCPHDLKTGDKVFFNRNEGNVIKTEDNREIISLKPERVLAVIT